MTFEELLNSGELDWFDASEETPQSHIIEVFKQVWNARQSEIDILKYENKELSRVMKEDDEYQSELEDKIDILESRISELTEKYETRIRKLKEYIEDLEKEREDEVLENKFYDRGYHDFSIPTST